MCVCVCVCVCVCACVYFVSFYFKKKIVVVFLIHTTVHLVYRMKRSIHKCQISHLL